jgi:hypothetical protein
MKCLRGGSQKIWESGSRRKLSFSRAEMHVKYTAAFPTLESLGSNMETSRTLTLTVSQRSQINVRSTVDLKTGLPSNAGRRFSNPKVETLVLCALT